MTYSNKYVNINLWFIAQNRVRAAVMKKKKRKKDKKKERIHTFWPTRIANSTSLGYKLTPYKSSVYTLSICNNPDERYDRDVMRYCEWFTQIMLHSTGCWEWLYIAWPFHFPAAILQEVHKYCLWDRPLSQTSSLSLHLSLSYALTRKHKCRLFLGFCLTELCLPKQSSWIF